mmetsp:Transcript_1613/g.5631  ORF Transcript_1613/g.5631 Transcript_1613/m.5631 type:complete len:344 (+) Transcript_1613:2080-3111(+)
MSFFLLVQRVLLLRVLPQQRERMRFFQLVQRLLMLLLLPLQCGVSLLLLGVNKLLQLHQLARHGLLRQARSIELLRAGAQLVERAAVKLLAGGTCCVQLRRELLRARWHGLQLLPQVLQLLRRLRQLLQRQVLRLPCLRHLGVCSRLLGAGVLAELQQLGVARVQHTQLILCHALRRSQAPFRLRRLLLRRSHLLAQSLQLLLTRAVVAAAAALGATGGIVAAAFVGGGAVAADLLLQLLVGRLQLRQLGLLTLEQQEQLLLARCARSRRGTMPAVVGGAVVACGGGRGGDAGRTVARCSRCALHALAFARHIGYSLLAALQLVAGARARTKEYQVAAFKLAA